MHAADYQSFTNQLTTNLQAIPQVIGLVLLGSTANQSHAPDEWSDHDFFVITESDKQEAFRVAFDWLPNFTSIVLTVRETAHGLKVVYADGHVLEFAIFDLPEISLAKANDYTVVFDRGGVSEAMNAIASPPEQATAYTDNAIRRDTGMFLSLLIIGAGRIARGEVISGQTFIRTHAVGHLLPLLAHHLSATDQSVLDNLDPLRRFEQVLPDEGEAIHAALNRDPIAAAGGLLDIFEQSLAHTAGYPAQAVIAVRQVLERASNR